MMFNNNNISFLENPPYVINNNNNSNFSFMNYNEINCLCIDHPNVDSYSGFSVVHQNIRSVRKNFDVFLAYLASLNHLPDLIFLSEIWIYDFEVANYIIPNFTFSAYCNNFDSAHRGI